MAEIKKDSLKKRKFSDLLKAGLAYIFSSFGLLCLFSIIIFIFSKGWNNLSWSFVTSDYNPQTLTVSGQREEKTYDDPQIDSVYFVSQWGIGLEDSYDASKKEIVIVSYIDSASPFTSLIDISDDSFYSLPLGASLDSGLLEDKNGNMVLAFASSKAEKMSEAFKQAEKIDSLTVKISGGGIRGSLISTIYMVVFTLLFSLPLGVLAAVYLNQYAPSGKITETIRRMIGLTGGIPSIIFGLIGALIFIPLVSSISGQRGGSILSGALTLSIMLLPTIISTTEEALKTVPPSLASASLALGASKTQTVFKVVLPNAFLGIMTAVLLSIGRIIGESAALIYAMGTSIKDQIILTSPSATLALHIWSLMGQENPDYQAAAGVAIIILLTDLGISLGVKIIGFFFKKKLKG